MHLADLGVCRQLCRLMFRFPGVKRPRMSRRASQVDCFVVNRSLKAVKLPSESSRRTRDFNVATYKAEEYRNLYLVLWPIIADVLPPKVREVWLMFVYIMRGLMQPSGPPATLTQAFVDKWHGKYCSLFGDEASGYNIHSFTHVLQLLEVGPLTSTSAVLHEGHYAEMKKRFKAGTPSTGQQALLDCHVRSLGTHKCQRQVVIKKKASEKSDDTLVVTAAGIIRVDQVHPGNRYSGHLLQLEPTNYPLAGLDFRAVGCHRIRRQGVEDNQALPVNLTKTDIVGKAVIALDYVSEVALDILRES